MDNHFFERGAYRLAFTPSGQPIPGQTLVVLETGLGMGADSWQAVQDLLPPNLPSLRYDRANRGASGRVSGPRSAADMLADLHALLQHWHPQGGLILVGQSFGGLLALLYASSLYASSLYASSLYAGQNPERVRGLVLIDPTQPGQFERVAAALPPAAESDSPALNRFRQFWSQGWRDPHANGEGIDLPHSLAQAAEVQSRGLQSSGLQSLGSLPLAVLAGTRPLPELADRPADAAALQALWLEMRRSLLGLSSNSRLILAPESGHFMQADRPDVVVEAILWAAGLV